MVSFIDSLSHTVEMLGYQICNKPLKPFYQVFYYEKEKDQTFSPLSIRIPLNRSKQSSTLEAFWTFFPDLLIISLLSAIICSTDSISNFVFKTPTTFFPSFNFLFFSKSTYRQLDYHVMTFSYIFSLNKYKKAETCTNYSTYTWNGLKLYAFNEDAPWSPIIRGKFI